MSSRPRFSGERVAALPSTPDATLRVPVVAGIMMYGSAVGVPLPEMMALSGVQPHQLSDPDATLRAIDAARVLARISEQVPGRAISLELMAVTPPSVFGLLDLAVQHASTFDDQIRLILRYSRLTSSHAHTWLERQDDLVAYRCRHLEPLEALRHPVELAVLHFHRALTRGGAQPDDLVEAHFGHAPVGPEAAFAEALGCPVHFESFGHALVMRSPLLERPIRHADPVLARSLATRLELELHEGDDALSALRRQVAQHARPAQYSAAAIAKRMGRSQRSLQREAAELGTTVRRILDDVRIARARELLLDDSLSVDEVGFLVDYSERAAFSRAFKRATGETPVDYRRRVAN